MTNKIPNFLKPLFDVALRRAVEHLLTKLEPLGINAIVLVNGAGGTSAYGIDPRKVTPAANDALQDIYDATSEDDKTVKHFDYFISMKSGEQVEATPVLGNEESFEAALREVGDGPCPVHGNEPCPEPSPADLGLGNIPGLGRLFR